MEETSSPARPCCLVDQALLRSSEHAASSTQPATITVAHVLRENVVLGKWNWMVGGKA